MVKVEHVQRFIDSYAGDLASGDGERIAGNYDLPALLIMTPDAAGTAMTDHGLLSQEFSAASKIYRSHGFGDPIGSVTRSEPVTNKFSLVWVTWEYRDRKGAPIYEADYVYGLREAEGRLLIATVFSINEPERIATWLQARRRADS
jgi:hypothetical protein